MSSEQEVRDSQAAEYESWYAASKGPVFDILERRLFVDAAADVCVRAGGASPPTCRILDLGAGTGRITEVVAPLASVVTAADLSKASLDILASKQLKNVIVQQCDLSVGLPFESGSFDLITACQVLQHIPAVSLPLVIKECRRVLRPGGRLAFSVYNLGYYGFSGVAETIDDNGVYFHRFSRGELAGLRGDAGFGQVGSRYYRSLPSRYYHRQAGREALTLLLDRVFCSAPGVGGKLSTYVFAQWVAPVAVVTRVKAGRKKAPAPRGVSP